MMALNGEIIPDCNVTFTDGVLYIIESKGLNFATAKVMHLHGDFGDSITLPEIERKYPDVELLIYEDATKGCVYRYGNHRYEPDAQMWEEVGTTRGYA